MDSLALIITLLIIATGLFSGSCLFLMLRKEGGGSIKRGIEIFCTNLPGFLVSFPASPSPIKKEK